MNHDKKLLRAYQRYNRKYFKGRLPNPPDIKLRWKDTGASLMGYQDDNKIVINSRHRKIEPVWRLTLFHEMCHVNSKDRAHHGKEFQARMMRLAKAGAFDRLW